MSRQCLSTSSVKLFCFSLGLRLYKNLVLHKTIPVSVAYSSQRCDWLIDHDDDKMVIKSVIVVRYALTTCICKIASTSCESTQHLKHVLASLKCRCGSLIGIQVTGLSMREKKTTFRLRIFIKCTVNSVTNSHAHTDEQPQNNER